MVGVNSFGVVNTGGVASICFSESMHLLMLTVSTLVPQPSPKKESSELRWILLSVVIFLPIRS